MAKPVPPGSARVRRSVMFSPSVTVLRGAKCGYVAFGLSTGNLDAGTSTAFILYNHIRTVKGANETPTTHKRTRTHGNANTHTRRVIHYSHMRCGSRRSRSSPLTSMAKETAITVGILPPSTPPSYLTPLEVVVVAALEAAPEAAYRGRPHRRRSRRRIHVRRRAALYSTRWCPRVAPSSVLPWLCSRVTGEVVVDCLERGAQLLELVELHQAALVLVVLSEQRCRLRRGLL